MQRQESTETVPDMDEWREEMAQLKATVVELRTEMEVRDTMMAHIFQKRMDEMCEEMREEIMFLRNEMEDRLKPLEEREEEAKVEERDKMEEHEEESSEEESSEEDPIAGSMAVQARALSMDVEVYMQFKVNADAVGMDVETYLRNQEAEAHKVDEEGKTLLWPNITQRCQHEPNMSQPGCLRLLVAPLGTPASPSPPG